MKILFVVNWYTPKSETVLKAGVFHYEQCMALKKYANADVRLFWPFDSEVKELESGIEKDLFVYRSPIKEGKTNKYRYLYQCFKKVIEDFRPDIIHANCANLSGFMSVIVAKKYNIPVVITEHTPIEMMDLDHLKNRYKYKYAYMHATNVCVSIDSMNRLKAVFPKANFVVNYNGIMDPANMNMGDMDYRIPNAVNCAIIAAFYSKNIKGYQYLIPAVKEANEKGASVVLHIVGGGTYEEYYKKLAKEIGADQYCVFHGQCNKEIVYTIASQMDFCVSASIYECSGVSVQEEMLMGKPVLVTKSGGANSLTTDYTAIVVDRNSKDALVSGLLEMSKKYKNFEPDRIKEYANKNFEISHVTQRYMEIYHQLLAGKH